MKKTLLLTLISLSALGSAQTFYRVTYDLSGLSVGVNHYINFQLLDGSATGNGNSSVEVTHVWSQNVTMASALPDIGNVSDITNGFRLTDGGSGFGDVADRAIAFKPLGTGARLSYVFRVTSFGIEAGTKDYFWSGLMDSSSTPLTSTGPSSTEFMSYLLFDSPFVTPESFDGAGVPKPTIEVVPEPASMLALGAGLALFARRRKK